MLPLGTSAVTVGFGFLITLDEPPLDLRTSVLLIPLAHALEFLRDADGARVHADHAGPDAVVHVLVHEHHAARRRGTAGRCW